jgi:hypothetical protein
VRSEAFDLSLYSGVYLGNCLLDSTYQVLLDRDIESHQTIEQTAFAVPLTSDPAIEWMAHTSTFSLLLILDNQTMASVNPSVLRPNQQQRPVCSVQHAGCYTPIEHSR